MRKLLFYLPLILLFLFYPSDLWAINRLDWKAHALIALVISIIGAMFWVSKNNEIKSTTGKIMGFGIYFWLIAFLQVTLYGLYYGMTK